MSATKYLYVVQACEKNEIVGLFTSATAAIRVAKSQSSEYGDDMIVLRYEPGKTYSIWDNDSDDMHERHFVGRAYTNGSGTVSDWEEY